MQTIRSAFKALEEGGVEGFLPFIHEDFEGVVSEELSAEPDSYRGHAGVKRYFALFDEAVEDLHFRLGEVRDLHDRLVLGFRLEGRGRESGIPVQMAVATVVELRDGKLVAMRSYQDLESAVAAAAGTPLHHDDPSTPGISSGSR